MHSFKEYLGYSSLCSAAVQSLIECLSSFDTTDFKTAQLLFSQLLLSLYRQVFCKLWVIHPKLIQYVSVCVHTLPYRHMQHTLTKYFDITALQRLRICAFCSLWDKRKNSSHIKSSGKKNKTKTRDFLGERNVGLCSRHRWLIVSVTKI